MSRNYSPSIVIERGIERVLCFDENEPFDVLGPHASGKEISIRAFLPRATHAWVAVQLNRMGQEKMFRMKRVNQGGIFEAFLPKSKHPLSYKIRSLDVDGTECEAEDPYAFPPDISDFDLQLFSEGNHLNIYEKLGAHIRTINGVKGVQFAVWAPNARSISVVGDFNHWRPGAHPMTRVHFSGVWALFVPILTEDRLYKFAVKGCDSAVRFKTDPFAQATELRPQTASRVTSLEPFDWSDVEWMNQRARQNLLAAPVSIYEVHLGSWRRSETSDHGFLSYRELAHELVSYVKEMGFTHIQIMPVMEHPLDESWGYQVVNFFAPTSRFGTPQEFMYFVNHCHQNQIGVLLDWVPGHFPTDGYGLSNFDGQEIFAYGNWKKREHREWGTFIFDYGKNEVRNFLLSNALFWFDRYHVDGLRVDAVASMLYLDYSRQPGEWEANQNGGNENLEFVSFIKRLNEIIYSRFPGAVTIAEESTAWPGVSRPTYLGGLGFGMKWNMGWMHDTLDFFSKDPIHRKWHQNALTFSLLYAFSENFILPFSHDEMAHGKRALLEKMPGDDWQKFANLRLLFGFMMAHPGKKLLFMGAEFAQRREWNCLESLDWHLLGYESHRQIQTWVKTLNQFYRTHPCLYEMDFEYAGFEWVDFSDAESSVISFIRWSRDRKNFVVAVCNMTPVVRHGYRVGVPAEGIYEEVLNSDNLQFGGSDVLNPGQLKTQAASWQGKPFALDLTLPPLGIILLEVRA